MHILHIIETLDFGGAEQVTVHLANQLSAHHRITLCLVKSRGELVSRLLPEVEVECLDLGEGIHASLPGRISSLVKSRDVDIVHVHNWALFFETWCGARLAGRPMLLTVHGPYTNYGPGFVPQLKRRLRHLVERLACRGDTVGRIVTVSDAIQRYIVDDIGIPGRKLQTIHNGAAGIDFEPVRYAGPVRLISVGRLAAIKNHRLMLEAFALALETIPELTLTLVGDGPERGRLEAQAAALNLDDKLSFLGFRNDIAELLAAHDIFLLSSDYEGISIALLEAMRMARPAIATDVGGISETIEDGHSGIVVAPGDNKALAEAIVLLAGSADLRLQMGRAAKQVFERGFHESIVLQKYLELYDQLGPARANRQ